MGEKKKKNAQSEKEKSSEDTAEITNPIDKIELDLPESGTDDENKSDSLSAEIDELKTQIEKLSKDYLLLMADFDNYRKRTLREKAELLKSGGEDCLKNMLPIIDDFERGLAVVGESSDIEAVKEGMNLIYSKFKKYLDKNGIKEIPTTNEDFNTEYHEAVTTFPAPKPEMKGKIIDCVQKGYTMNDKVIRFSKVVVGE